MQKKKKVIKGSILFAIYIAIFAFLIHYVSNNTDMLTRIMNASHYDVLSGFLCSVICIVLTGIMDVTCAHVYGVNIGYGESVGLTYVASAINLILPLQMGSVVKAVYLKKRLSLTYARYISIISGTAVINLIITFIQVILCMIIVSYGMATDVSCTWLLIVVFMAMVLMIALVVKKQDMIIRILPFKRISVPIMEGFFELISDRRAVVLVALNLICSSLAGGVRFCFIFRMLGFDGSILDGILYYGLYNASAIVPILPGNIGISELFVGIMNRVLGSEFDTGVTTVLVNRVYYYVAAITGTLVATLPLWINYNKRE